ncbi:MAG TPA: hypothetical protein VMB24_06360 [Dehalococcoidales bacterium]|nr:hypothetical protein [Dehalococcoidales bacterium]
MALDEPTKDEKPVNINGVDVLIAEFVQSMTDETVIDYVDEPSGRGFLIRGASAC